MKHRMYTLCATLLSIPVLHRCQAFDRAEYARLTGRFDASADGTASHSDASTDGAAVVCAARTRDAGPGCELAIIPSPPPGLRNIPGETRVFAVRRVLLGAGGAWASIGFDRDGMCTTPNPPDGGAPNVPCRSPLVLADGMNGRDNAFGSVIGQVGVFGNSFNENRLNDNIADGSSTIGLRLRDFGGINDGSITVELLPLVHGHPPSNPTAMPNWDGHDEWSIHRGLAYGADGRTIRISTTDAFTSCGTIVIPFANNAPLYFANARNRTQITLTDIRLVGQLDAMGNVTTLDLSALWARNQIYEDLRTFGVCQERLLPMQWTTILLAIEASLDITASGVPNPEADCSAMSVALRFELVPITVSGDETPPPPIVADPCAEGSDAGTRD